MSAYKTAMGEPLAVLHADVFYESNEYIPVLQQLQSLLQSENVTFGICYSLILILKLP